MDNGSVNGRVVVGTYVRYHEAEAVVDALSDDGFPVENLAIEGRGLRMVEVVTGRTTYGSAALQGAASGAIIGLFVGLLFGLLSWFAPTASVLVLAVWGAIVGAVWGVGLGIGGHWLRQGRRDFDTVRSMQAERYDLTSEPAFADEARRRIAGRESLRR